MPIIKIMHSDSLSDIIKYVLTSWQVIAVTVAIVVYLNIVFYVARYYRTPRISSIRGKISFKRKKHENDPSSSGPQEVLSHNDELGLEE